MKEIEVKILNVSHIKLEQKLFELGAKKIFDGELYAIFFDTPDKKIKKTGGTLRLRKEGNKTIITHKQKILDKDVKIREENEVEVFGFEQMKKIFLALGFEEVDIIRKKRVSYKIQNVKFEFDTFLDQYGYVPEFMEIEAKSADEIYKYAELLRFKKEDCKPWTAKDISEYYLNNN